MCFVYSNISRNFHIDFCFIAIKCCHSHCFYTVWNFNILNICCLKSRISYSFNIITKFYLFKFFAFIKCLFFNNFNTIWNFYFLDIIAIPKCKTFYFSNLFSYVHFFKFLTVSKSSRFNFLHFIRYTYASYFRMTKRIFSNFLYAFSNYNLLQFFTI